MSDQPVNQTKSFNDPLLDHEIVRNIAKLIHIDLGDDLADIYAHQFSEIIGFFQLLEKIDTSNVIPANEKSIMNSVTRDDVITPSIKQEEFFKNVPEIERHFVKIPNVFDER